MSDQPASTANDEIVEQALKWTGLLMWLGFLFAAALSSIYLVISIVQGSSLVSFVINTNQSDFSGRDSEQTLAAIALVMTLIAALSLLGAWITIGRLAHFLVEEAVSGGGLEGSGAPVGWLGSNSGFPFSLPMTTAVLLGITWAVLMITPPALVFLRLVLQD